MTLAHFQAAVAHLIRVHDGGVRPANWQDRFATFELSNAERDSLALIAADEEVFIYGSEQASQRWSSTIGKLFRVRKAVDIDLLEDYWEQHFDPLYPTLETDASSERATYTIAFLDEFLASPPTWLPDQVRACLADLVALDRAEIELAQAYIVSPPLTAGSRVAHDAWRLVDIEHDITQWQEDCAEAALAGAPQPSAKPCAMTLLVVRAEGMRAMPRVFEVDDNLRRYLLGEIRRGPVCETTPEIAADLEALGLCAPAVATAKI